MTTPIACLLAAAFALAHGGAAAQADSTRVTAELGGTASRLTDGLPDGRVAEARATWELPGGHVARAELVDESRFSRRGGILGASYARVLSPDWIVGGSLAVGHGGPIWAQVRYELEATAKWLAGGQLLTRVAYYHAAFDAGRSDEGLRVSAIGYLPGSWVAEAGVVANVSAPGSVNSRMPFASLTWGREGTAYVSATVRKGTEAYEALGNDRQLVDFKSRSARLAWRGWVGPNWGFTAQAEHYRNPTYERSTLGAGVFATWP